MWFYSRDRERTGPVPLESLVAEVVAGRVRDHDLLWREGMESWVPSSEVLEVQRAVADARLAQVTPGGPRPSVAAMTMATNPLALTSMILGILSIVLGTLILTGLPAVICGHMARRQIRAASHPMGGDGMAIAGLILGYLSIIFTLALVGFLVSMVLVAGQAVGLP